MIDKFKPKLPRLPYPFIPPFDPPSEQPPYVPPKSPGGEGGGSPSEDPGPRPPWWPEDWPWPPPPDEPVVMRAICIARSARVISISLLVGSPVLMRHARTSTYGKNGLRLPCATNQHSPIAYWLASAVPHGGWQADAVRQRLDSRLGNLPPADMHPALQILPMEMSSTGLPRHHVPQAERRDEPAWQLFRDYQACPSTASDDEVRGFLVTREIPQCRLCPAKRIPCYHRAPVLSQ